MTKRISHYVKSFLLFGLALSTLIGTAIAEGMPVTGGKLAALLTNKTVRVNAKYGANLIITFSSDGRYCSRSALRYDCAKGKYDPYVGWVGPWRIRGEKMCLTHPKANAESCYQVNEIGSGEYRLIGVGGRLDEGVLSPHSLAQPSKK
ncbi:MAG: hypothetical protein P8Z76_21250 [Alphaproteobacteria bacterium]